MVQPGSIVAVACAWYWSSDMALGLDQQRVMRRSTGGDDLGLAQPMRQLDARPRVGDPEALPLQHPLVDARMEIVESFAELDLLAINRDRSERRLAAGLRDERQVCRTRRQQPLHTRSL